MPFPASTPPCHPEKRSDEDLLPNAILFLIWILAGSRAFSNRGLRRLDAAATIAASLAYAMMVLTMPLAWRPDQLVLLILNAVLLGRAALVPSQPRRTAWISAASVAAMPIVTFLLIRQDASRELLPGAVVTQATLWATFTVILATLISNVTFHLRRSVARARRLGQYTLLEKIGEGGMGVVYRAEHEMLRRPTAIKLLPPASAGEESLKRFEREAQLTARLTSPHTVSVYDCAKVVDFGLVKDVTGSADTRLTREDVVAGTPQYLAPETLRDGQFRPPERPLRSRRRRLLSPDRDPRVRRTPDRRDPEPSQTPLRNPRPPAWAVPCPRSSSASSSTASKRTRPDAPRPRRRSPTASQPATT